MKIEPGTINENDIIRLILPGRYLFIRRIVELLIILLFLPVIIPLFLVIALYIWLTAGSPVFFRQYRPGLNDSLFKIYKFRTLKKDFGTAQAYNYEKEIIRGGKFLRKHRIDEIPQLINVILGDMSLIGPRPDALDYYEECKKAIPLYKFRFRLKPGLTGWAQIKYKHTDDYAGAYEKLKYDLFYIYNISPKLDFMIFWSTFYVVFRG